MTISEKGIDLIKKYESLKLKAYPDPGTGGKPYTIGWGTTMYPDGKRVQLGDIITTEQAETYLRTDIARREAAIGQINGLNQNKWDSIVSFVYNTGLGNWNKSTIKKKILSNPNDPTIVAEYAKWNRGGGKVLNGLTRRRKEEAEIYFS